ncbi:MAG: hypothetical protein QOI99_781 [Actinomycetota bacterium]|jgi:hypothetical protein|nr:hypothetical protein [Actinomycetota bacterium]
MADIGEREKRRQLARETYLEVLDATKHQDDKIGRFLAGIAFLTSGAIAFGFRGEVLLIHYRAKDGLVPYPALAFSAFLLLVLLGVLLLIISLGPNLSLPKGSHGNRRSRLFFFVIADETPDEWRARWAADVDIATIETEITMNYIDETANIADKTVFKYHRTGEARAVLSLGILALAIGVLLAVNAWSAATVIDQRSIDLTGLHAAPWTLRPQLLSASAISLFVAVLAYDFYRLEQSLKEQRSESRSKRLGWPATALVAFPPVVLLAPARPASPGMGGVALLGLAAWFLRGRFRGPVRIAGGVVTFLLAFGTMVVFALGLEQWQLLVAAGPAVLVEMPRLTSASDSWSRRSRSAQRRASASRVTDEAPDGG